MNLPKTPNNTLLNYTPLPKGVSRPNLPQAQSSANVYKPEYHVNKIPNNSIPPLSLSPSTQTLSRTGNDNPSHAILKIFSWNARSMNSRNKQLFTQSRPEEIICVQEIWGARLNVLHAGLDKSRYNVSQRTNLCGGGSLTLLKGSVLIHQSSPVDKDSNLLRLIVHGNKILWLCNTYLNLGKVSQVQKLFKTILERVPKDELNRVVIIGDLNIDVQKKESEKFKLLKTLAGQLGLEILEPSTGTLGSSKLDITIVAKGLKGNLIVETSDLSDHLPIVLNIPPSFVNKDHHKVSLPNSKLARILTKEALINASSAETMLQIHRIGFKAHCKRSMKRGKRMDYERKLFHLLTEKKNIAISEVIQEYWTSLLNENELLRFSPESSKAFKQLQNIFGYKSFEKRDGGIVNFVLIEDKIISDIDEVNKALIEVLRSIQVDESKPIPAPQPFPDLDPLSDEEASRIVERMATNKAISFDLFSDVIFSKELKEKTSNTIKDLWSYETSKYFTDINFEARLIPLNKKFPEIPKPEEFRPIIVMSPLVKLLEARILEKLQSYLSQKLHRSQTGFVPRLDIFVNIHRAIKQIKKSIDNKGRVFCLFLDFKSA